MYKKPSFDREHENYLVQDYETKIFDRDHFSYLFVWDSLHSGLQHLTLICRFFNYYTNIRTTTLF